MNSKRRSHRRSFTRKKKVKPNYLPVVIILCLSVGCGYATAKYVVEPAVNYVPELTAKYEDSEEKETKAEKEKTKTEKETKVIEDDVKVEQAEKVKGYAVQLGCFSSESSAKTAMSGFGIDGLQIVEQNEMYKVIGKVYDTKEEAGKALKDISEDKKSNAFVATIYQ
ncbi:MAG: SPOR domain-containing protein [Clostridiales bacterium]|nr:SPOR domain-containing protein [Clostridiales bacterium]